MVEDARRNSFRIIPLCPYVQAQYKNHPAWADVFTTTPGEVPDGRSSRRIRWGSST
jgi:hypothetical protein